MTNSTKYSTNLLFLPLIQFTVQPVLFNLFLSFQGLAPQPFLQTNTLARSFPAVLTF